MQRGLTAVALAASLLMTIGCSTNQTAAPASEASAAAEARPPATVEEGAAAAGNNEDVCAALTVAVDAARAQNEALSSGILAAAASDEQVRDLASLYGTWVEEINVRAQQLDDPQLTAALERIVSEFEALSEMRSVEDLQAAAQSDMTQLEAAFDEVDRVCG